MRGGAVAAAVLVMVTSGAAQPGEAAEPRKLLLSWATSEFLAVEGPRLRLQHRYRLDEPSLWLEAEHPSSMQLEANTTVGSDPEAVGGRCVGFVDRLDFVIDVAAPGLYQSWTRCFLPFAASWNHTEGMAREDMHVVDDLQSGDAELAGRWVWRKGPQYQLTAGTANYVFDGYHGGARLDRILLTSDLQFVPEGPGEPSSVNIAAHRTGLAETRDLRLGPVAQWLRLAGLPATHMQAQVSLDAGQSWVTVPPDGSLAGLSASPRDPVRLRVRVQLTRDEAMDPIVDAVRLVYVPGEQEVWTVANQHLRASFDPLTGSLLNLEKLAGEAPVPYVLMGEQLPLFNLYVQQSDRLDALIPVSSLDGEVSGRVSAGGRRVEMDFSLLEGRLHAFVSCEADDTPLMRWRLRVRNDSQAKVFAAQFPLLHNLCLGEAPADDVMVLPWWGAGSRTADPSSAEWTPYRKLLNYPGAASMQWLDLHDPSGGLYVAAYDPTCRDLELGYTRDRGRSVTVTFKKSFLLAPGAEWSCDYAVGVHEGDWHWGADRYRQWARTWQQPPPTPAWVADTDGWMLPDGANLLGYPSLPVCYGIKRAALGMNWMQCWAQMTEAESCCGQFHYPSPLWGTPEDFRLACQAVHDAGGRLGFYINAQLYKPWHNSAATSIGAVPTEFIPDDVLAPYDPQWAFRWQAKDFAGQPYDQPSTSPFHDGVRMNPASRGWQDHLVHWAAEWYVGALGTDCIYFDQLAAAPSLPVYNDEQSDYGLWGRGYQQMLDRLLSRVQPEHREFVLSMEGTSDVHGQQVATALYGTGPDLFDVYHYTFPEHILIDYGACVNKNRDGFPGERPLYLNTFLMGTRFSEYPLDDFGHALFDLRRRTQSLIFRAAYRDTVGVQSSDPAVRVKRFERDDPNCRAMLVNLGNLDAKIDATVTADLGPVSQVAAAWLLGSDGSTLRLDYAREGTSVTFAAPVCDAATAVFAERIGPVVSAVGFPANVVVDSLVTGTVEVTNLSPALMNGRVGLTTPEGWTSEAAPFTDLPPGESATLTLSIRIPGSAQRAIHGLMVVAKSSGGEDSRYVGLAVVPPVAITRARVLGDGIEARLVNRAPRPVTCRASLDLFEGAEGLAIEETLELGPGEEATVNFRADWPDLSHARLPQTVRVIAQSEGLSAGLPLRVGPPVINGGFDMALINEDKPEGWSIFGNRPDQVHVVKDHPFDGTACLRVDPAPTGPNVDQIVTLQPDSTYRLTAALRRAEQRGGPTVWVAVREGLGKIHSTHLTLPPEDTSVNEWYEVSAVFTTPPVVMYAILYACNAGNAGPVWIDAVRIEKVTQ